MKICPNCHEKNPDEAQFCKACGYELKKQKVTPSPIHLIKHKHPMPVKHEQKEKTAKKMPQYSRVNRLKKKQAQQWQNANATMDKAGYYSRDYFTWLLHSLLHPDRTEKGSPYFGALSFGIEAVLLWFSALVMSHSGYLSGFLQQSFSYLPFKSILNKTSVWVSSTLPEVSLIYIVVSLCLLVLLPTVISNINHQKSNCLQIADTIAYETNLAIPVAIILLLAPLFNFCGVTILALWLVKLVFILGLARVIANYTMQSKLSYIYWSIGICFVFLLLQGTVFSLSCLMI